MSGPGRSTTPVDARRAAGALLVRFAVLLGVVLLTGWLLTHGLSDSVGRADDDLARDLAAHRTRLLSDLADAGTLVGQTLTGLVVLGVLGVAVSLWRTSWRPVLFVAVTYGGVGLVYFAATRLDPRPRPPVRILDSGLVPDRSFPSGHTGTAACIALCAAALLAAYVVGRRRWLWALLLLPVFTGASRLYQGAHHLTDVLTALVTALVWGAVCARRILPAPEAPAQ